MPSLFSIGCLETQLNIHSVCNYMSKTISQPVVKSSTSTYSFRIFLVLVQVVSGVKSNTIVISTVLTLLSFSSKPAFSEKTHYIILARSVLTLTF